MKILDNGKYVYEFKDHLGTGSFGSVFKCKDTTTNKIYALKIIERKKLNQYGEYLQTALKREIETQKQATESKIPFFVGLYDTFEDKKNIYIILEYCQRSLLDFLHKVKLKEEQSLELIFQVALGLKYLHSVHITHRDIKPENILMKDGILKIADFGFASNSSQLMTNLGTAPYMSPELFEEGDEAYTPKVDVWALNTCLYKLLTGKFFFWSPNKRILEKKIIEQKFEVDDKFGISAVTKDLLIRGYFKDPSERLSMQEYVEHQAFKNFHSKYARFMQKKMIIPNPNSLNNTPTPLPEKKIPKKVNHHYLETFFNLRNNSLNYSLLSKSLIENGMNKIIAFYLLKKNIQNLTAVVLAYKFSKPPKFGPFSKFAISPDEWQELINFKEMKQIIALYIKDINYLIKRYSELFKTIQMCLQNKSRGLAPKYVNWIFNLNNSVDSNSIVKFVDYLNMGKDKLRGRVQGLEEILRLAGFVQVYEYKNPMAVLK